MTAIWIIGMIGIVAVTVLRLLPFKGKAGVLCRTAAYLINVSAGLYILISSGSLVYVSVYLLGSEIPALIRDAGRIDI